jgi:hypothetical protein
MFVTFHVFQEWFFLTLWKYDIDALFSFEVFNNGRENMLHQTCPYVTVQYGLVRTFGLLRSHFSAFVVSSQFLDTLYIIEHLSKYKI